jgi:hypothetical protein
MTGSEDNLINIFNINKEDKFNTIYPEVTLNCNQPVSICNFLDDNNKFVDVITTVNTYHILNENSSEVFGFNAISDIYKTEFIINSFFCPNENIVELFCGNHGYINVLFRGDLILMKILLEEKPTISVDSMLSTNHVQSISNITKINEKVRRVFK